MKALLGSLLSDRPKLQNIAMKAGTYPRFLDWTRANAGKDRITGGEREKRNSVFAAVAEECALLAEPITYLEFGVHKGVSIAWWYGHNQFEASRFYGFDSFEGLPEDWNSDRGIGTFDVNGQAPLTDDSRVTFVKGWFHQTLPGQLQILETPNRRVIHMDADLYRSSIYPLCLMGPYIHDNDIMIFDEFADSIHEFRAFEDFRQIFGIEAELIVASSGFNQSAFRLRVKG
jgi:hypothetical protein